MKIGLLGAGRIGRIHGMNVAARGDAELEQAAGDALAKIVAVLPPAMDDVAATSGLVAGPVAGETPHLAIVRHALRAEEKLHLHYRDKQGRASERVIWPVALGFFEAAEVLAAWCETRRDFRHFRLDRITAAAPTGSRYPKRRRLLLAEWRMQQAIDP